MNNMYLMSSLQRLKKSQVSGSREASQRGVNCDYLNRSLRLNSFKKIIMHRIESF